MFSKHENILLKHEHERLMKVIYESELEINENDYWSELEWQREMKVLKVGCDHICE